MPTNEPVPTACGVCQLGGVCLCSALPPEERLQLVSKVSQHSVIRGGELLYRAGDNFSCFFAIKSGYTKQYAQNRRGEERIVAFHMDGDTLGLEALHKGRHEVSAMALTDVTVCRITMADFDRIAANVPAMQRQLMKILSNDCARHHRWLVTENLRAERRVAAFLLEISDKRSARGADARRFTLPMTRAEIGSFLNLAHETVTRTLTKLSKDGLLTTRRRRIVIDDIAALCELSGDTSCGKYQQN
ncbi:MAG: helix-turn-helix domain-containing protein [Gammaproteobacteria bacterium]|nr:helix-turn-helix domain-containing protein [Gammaproteobacteria bacterium]